MNDGLNKIGKHSIVCLREPSLGPSFGMKGGAAGGGYAQVIPMEQINLHFTGDFHAITSAHNLLSALIDNHIYWGNKLNIDPSNIVWKRVVDLNDRALRKIEINLEKLKANTPRNDSFDITNEQNVKSYIDNEKSIYDLVIIATGGVQIDNDEPEKSIKRLNAKAMLNQFSLNALGPALILSRIHKLIPKDRPSHVIVLSARVGSIEDNNLGGWISYRTAKAALNQILRTSAIELKRTHPNACLLAIHPGTVETKMTNKYTSHSKVSAETAAKNIANLIIKNTPTDTGKFYDWAGKIIPW